MNSLVRPSHFFPVGDIAGENLLNLLFGQATYTVAGIGYDGNAVFAQDILCQVDRFFISQLTGSGADIYRSIAAGLNTYG